MLEILESVPSTMDAARDNVRAGRVTFDAQGGAFPTGVVAREQTAGRGQRGRTWYARAGECLCATYYFQHGLATPEQAGQAAFVAGVAAAETLQQICREAMYRGQIYQEASGNEAHALPRVGLKWPNDLLLNGRKAGGILIEVTDLIEAAETTKATTLPERTKLPVALIGVGINVDVLDFPPELAPLATSLQREGVDYGDGIGWRLLGERIADRLAHWGEIWRVSGLQTVLDRWRDFDQTPGRGYETVLNGRKTAGRAEGIDSAGALLLRLEDGSLAAVYSASSLVEQD